MQEITITQQNFENEVLKSDKPVLIDFWAPWCGPCRMLGPIIEELAKEHPEVKVGKINVDDEYALAEAFHVTSIPLVVLMQDGKIVQTSLGYKPKEELETMLR